MVRRCKMQLLLIPYLLAATIDKNEKSKWKFFGPECSFNLQVTTELYVHSKQVQYKEIFSTVKCRYKSIDTLFCHLQYHKTFDEQMEFDESDISAIFEMKFNESGVQTILTNSSNTFKKELIQKFAQQLSTGINVHHFNGNSINYTVNKTSTCQTMYNIEYHEPKIKMAKQNTSYFQFMVLPSFDLKPNSTFVIRTLVVNCDYKNWIYSLLDWTVSQIKFSGTIRINDDKFETWTELIDSTFNTNRYTIFQNTYVKETIRLKLESIKPAQQEPPMCISNGTWFSPIYRNMQTNIN